jgi:hypothetical protein
VNNKVRTEPEEAPGKSKEGASKKRMVHCLKGFWQVKHRRKGSPTGQNGKHCGFEESTSRH